VISLPRLVAAALLLAFAIIVSSAFIRLSQYGLSCADWPACYGRLPPGAEDSAVFAARVIHRITASAAGILFIVIVAFGWSRWRKPSQRAVGVALLALAGFLAWLGRYTPSPLPAVMLANLLGGVALAALLAWLFLADAEGTASPRLRVWTWTALALVTLQIALGGLIGARLAALDCPGLPACAGSFGPESIDWRVFDPFDESAFGAASRRALHLAHRFGALATVAALAVVGWRHARLRGVLAGFGWTLLALTAAQLVLGAAMLLADLPLPLALAHNAVAALTLALLAGMLSYSPRREPA